MNTKNTVYKGKSLLVYRDNMNNKNHNSKYQNDKHTHYFLIHLNLKNKFKNIKNTQIHGKDLFSQKYLETAQEVQMNLFNLFFAFLTLRSCLRLH